MSKAIVFDTETTGSKQPMHIVEAAYIVLDDELQIADTFQGLFTPEMPIALGAKAAHHILDCEVASMPLWSTFSLPEDTAYVIGHKVDFDMDAIGLAEDTEIKRICTLAIARKHLPELDSHTQSALIYHFFPEVTAREMIKNAHRAMDDVNNCHMLLCELSDVITSKGIAFETFEDMWVESEHCRIPDKMSFGKHAGANITDLPYDYKQWIMRQPDMDKYLKLAVKASM